MSVTAHDFFSSAEKALLDGTEIGFRNATSRSYYSIYHQMLDFVNRYHQPDPTANQKMSSHERLIERVRLLKDTPTARSTAIMLQNMKLQRCISDYEIDTEIRQLDAELQLATAKRIHQRLDSYRSTFAAALAK